MRLLLISNSKTFGGGYLDHCADAITDFLGPIKSILFVPYALKDHDMYAQIAQERFQKLGFTLTSIHTQNDPISAIQQADSLFIGGGNTFRLLNELYQQKIIDPIRQKVTSGMPFIGSSAGSNVACVTIKTTNDMPIIYPPSFDALNLVPFNINPHYLDPDPNTKHMGETRDQRIKEFHEENEDKTVVGLREGAWLRVEGQKVTLEGTTGAKVFTSGEDPQNYDPGASLDFLLN